MICQRLGWRSDCWTKIIRAHLKPLKPCKLLDGPNKPWKVPPGGALPRRFAVRHPEHPAPRSKFPSPLGDPEWKKHEQPLEAWHAVRVPPGSRAPTSAPGKDCAVKSHMWWYSAWLRAHRTRISWPSQLKPKWSSWWLLCWCPSSYHVCCSFDILASIFFDLLMFVNDQLFLHLFCLENLAFGFVWLFTALYIWF